MQEVNKNYQDDEVVIDLKEIFIALKKNWKPISVITIVTTVIALCYSLFFITPMYQAKSIIYLRSVDGGSTSEILQGLQIGSQLAPDYEIFFKSRPVVERVIKEQNLDVTVNALNQQVSITNPKDTHMLVITVNDSDPVRACNIANSYVKYGIEQVREVQVKEPYVVESAIVNNQKVSPSNSKNTILGMLVGLVLSCGIITLKVVFNDRLKGSEQIERVLGANVIVSIAADESINFGRNDTRKRNIKRIKGGRNNA